MRPRRPRPRRTFLQEGRTNDTGPRRASSHQLCDPKPVREELWAVGTAQPRTGFGEPSYRALFAVAVASDEVASPITRCELGWTPLAAKRPIDRATAAALHPELVRRADAEWATLDDAGSPDNAAGDTGGTGGTGGDGAAVLDELDRLDPALDIAEVDALLIAEVGEA